MGPITLFDKSFLQMLSVDESVWFDHFFHPNICPLFYVETLADLAKSGVDHRSVEDEVKIIANKFPEITGWPNIYHATLCISELMGQRVPMKKCIVCNFEKIIKLDNKFGAVANIPPEAEAFKRWQAKEFLEVERQFAQDWRAGIQHFDANKITEQLALLKLDQQNCRNLKDAKALAERTINSSENKELLMNAALIFLNIPNKFYMDIHKNWSINNYPLLSKYAPYVAYVLEIELFYRLALDNNLISNKLATNRIDMAYLFYLPFCMQFVSCDKFHRNCAPLFLQKDQLFIWGEDLKCGLAQINEYYSKFPVTVKEKGLSNFAHIPPIEGNFFVAELWDKHFPNWRKRKYIDPDDEKIPRATIVKDINTAVNSKPLLPAEIDYSQLDDMDNITMTRAIREKKGMWYQIPKSK